MNTKQKMIRCFFAIATTITLFTANANAQVTIGSVKEPDGSAILDIDNGTARKGILFPRVSLTDLAVWSLDNTTSAVGMVVYNTNATLAGITGDARGIYHWDGGKWVRGDGGKGTTDSWLLKGNSATNPNFNATTNPLPDFIGTADNQDLVFSTNSIEKMRLSASGNLGIGTTTPANKLHLAANADPLKVDGLVLNDDADKTNSYNLIIGKDGVVRTQNIPDGQPVTGAVTKLVASAGFDSESVPYCTAEYVNAQIRGLIFTGPRYDPGNAYNNQTGVFTAPDDGYYRFEATLLLYNAAGTDLRSSLFRLGVSKPGELTFVHGNASFANLNQPLGTSRDSATPIVIPFTGMQYLSKGQQVTFGIRYIDPATMTMAVSNMNYDVKTASYMIITYVGQ